MKIVILNGSPRKNGNTAALCETFQGGARSISADCEILMFNLNDISFKGCQSCFACKLKNSRLYGHCSLNDGLSPILEEIESADCLVVASPIYLMDVTAATKACLERLCFSLGSYEEGYRSLSKKATKVVTIYTMNTVEDFAPVHAMDNIDMFLGHVFTKPQRLCAYNTYQFTDYSKFVVEMFDEKAKAAYRKEHWPGDLCRCHDLACEIAKELKTL